MIITKKTREEMNDDIKECKAHTDINGSEKLYGKLVAKYSVLDADFKKNLSTTGKASVIGKEPDYRQELQAIAEKLKMMLTEAEPYTIEECGTSVLSISKMMANDILKCSQYIEDPNDEKLGHDLYVEITSKYDSVIKDFGNGLYQYSEKQHFYDPEISNDTLIYNLTVLINKMKTYFAQHFYCQRIKNSVENKLMSKKVFVVHGHDEVAKKSMELFLKEIGYEPVVLSEQPSLGKTIIEKIEEYSDVPFGVVLYTECDKGRGKNEDATAERYRARQNVVFEHGYLIGRLGRENVCALVRGNIETPGDISGVVYIKMDEDDGWKLKLAQEMKKAGLIVDMNSIR